MNILILAAGEGDAGDDRNFPVWLSEVDGSLLLERQVNGFRTLEPSRHVFVFRTPEIEKHFLRDIVEQIAPGAEVVSVRGETAGAACTALLAAGAIAIDEELIIASATDHVDIDVKAAIDGFRARGADAGVFSFDALHPRYSYVLLDDDGWVIESAEKRPISRNASAGLYWFRSARDFVEGAMRMILKDAHVQGRFYVCPVLNELILTQKRIAVHRLDLDQYHPVKSARQIDRFERDLGEATTDAA